MKKYTLKAIASFLALNIMFTTGLFAAEGLDTKVEIEEDIFALEDDFYSDFAELEALELKIKSEGVADYNSLVQTNPDLLADLNLTELKAVNSIEATEGFSIDDMDWGSFAWGLLCCPIGFFVVAINGNKSKEQKTSFWIGWGVGVVLNLLTTAVAGNPFN
ncbi:MAG: hypothetical protein WBA74_25430 [Cyclobacteriaceae bacterium]